MKQTVSLEIPESKINGSFLNENEEQILLNFIEKYPEIDLVTLPNVRDASEVIRLRRKLMQINVEQRVKLIAKIQSTESLMNFEDILDASDGFRVHKDCFE